MAEVWDCYDEDFTLVKNKEELATWRIFELLPKWEEADEDKYNE